MPRYYENELVTRSGSSYACILEHDSSTDSAPGTGATWETYWILLAQGGEIGSQIFTGDGAPSDTLGINGDFYLNNLNGDYYKKATATWGTPEGNLTPGSGETNTMSSNGGGVSIYDTKVGVDLQIRSLNSAQFAEASDLISLAIAAPGPDYTPPSIKYKDADEITIPDGEYYPLGYRRDGQYRTKNYVPWTVAAAFDVDVDLAGNMIGGDTPNAWYSVFLTSASTVLVLPFIRPNAVNFSVDVTELYPAAHDDGTTANTTFVNANDCFNTYRLVLLTMGTYHGNVYTIADTVNDASDKIKISGNVSAEIAAGQWLQMIPPAGTDCLYLGCIRLGSGGDLEWFRKKGWTTEKAYTSIVLNKALIASLANTDLGPAIPPVATKINADIVISLTTVSSRGGLCRLYRGTSGVDKMHAYRMQTTNSTTIFGYHGSTDIPLSAIGLLRNHIAYYNTSDVETAIAGGDIGRIDIYEYTE